MEASTLQAPVALSRISVSAPLLRLRSDDQLVALFRAGSDDAFRAIHDRYRARLLAYARQMLGGSRHDAEDAMQDVFMRAHAALRSSDRPVSLRAWLYRVAHNRCVDQLRRPAPEAADLFDLSRRPTLDPPLETERRDELRRLVIDVGRLPEQQRSALLMREMQGMSYEEMSHAMDVSVAAVKSLLVRARGGLVDSAHARDAACTTVRREVALACDRGVRGSGLVRRHLRDCPGCREYRDRLRGARRRLAAFVPVGPLGLLAQTLGLGGGGAATAGGAGVLSGGGAIITATKVALVCAAAVTAGTGALEVAHREMRHLSPAPPARVATTGHVAGAESWSTPVALGGANLALRTPQQSLAPLTGARDLVTTSPTPPVRSHHPAPPAPQFITGQDAYPIGSTQAVPSATVDTSTPGSSPSGTSAGNVSGADSGSQSTTTKPASGSAGPSGAGGGSTYSATPSGAKGSPGGSSASGAGSQPGSRPGAGASAPTGSETATASSAPTAGGSSPSPGSTAAPSAG